jgi:hypothetical protein
MWVLSEVFEDMLPASVVWKRAVYDGGYGWIDKLKEVAVAKVVTDEQLEMQHFALIANTCIQRGIILSFPFSRASRCCSTMCS